MAKPARKRFAKHQKSRKPVRKTARARGAKPRSAAGRRWVYLFGDGKADGKAGMRDLLGGKGANLAEMANLGLPVPPGFTITTEVCTYYYDHGRSYPEELKVQVETALDFVGKLTGRTFGDAQNPLL